ncbi:uncharacterized protein FIBRA_02252 [Fibroporia radiculosa]|uniref:DUF262 domain-containing protein n=1 Tax=Fibroporia radiculosa TaxID=599839 RepID=J4H1R3_9APHY|nr:uncharacterized protein FIBRA_02252 [Fibroporia radiculosa]CCM00224.1 predicted protein [Fibroporia radiculosa]
MSLSDFDSDLTELSSEEEEYIPAPTRRKKNATNKEYKIQNALRPPRTTQYTAKSLYDQIVDNAIILDPEYQRAVTAQDDGTETRTCIDGKQRLTSIQRFMDGLICHKDSQTNKRYWYRDGPGSKRMILPKQYMQAFANKQITCVEYDCLTGDQEREIFQRVQLGVALTPAERMQALTGERATLIREVQSNILGEEGFGDNLDWGRARGRDFQCLASIVYLMDHHPNTTFPGAAQLEKWLQLASRLTATFRNEVTETFKIFVALVKDKRFNAAFQKPTRVSPIEFTMTGILIYLNRTKLSMTQLSSAIWKMRADVRAKYVDIRANTKVTKTMFAFISKGLKLADLKSDGKGDVLASVAINAPPEVQKKNQKRKRIESDPEDNEDEVQRKPLPPKASTSKSAPTKAPVTTKNRQVTQTKVTKTPKSTTSKTVTNGKSATQASATPISTKPIKRISSSSEVTTPTQPSGPALSTTVPAVTSSTPSGSGTINERQDSSSSNPQTPLPLALPRRSPLSLSQTSGDVTKKDLRPVKSEPEPTTLLSGGTPGLGQFSTSHAIDRLAAVRLAKANAASGGSMSWLIDNRPAVISSTQLPPDILTDTATMIKREPTQLNPLETCSIPAQPAAMQIVSPFMTALQQIDRDSIEKLLALHGIGQFAQPAQPLIQNFEQSPEQPAAQSSLTRAQVPVSAASLPTVQESPSSTQPLANARPLTLTLDEPTSGTSSQLPAVSAPVSTALSPGPSMHSPSSSSGTSSAVQSQIPQAGVIVPAKRWSEGQAMNGQAPHLPSSNHQPHAPALSPPPPVTKDPPVAPRSFRGAYTQPSQPLLPPPPLPSAPPPPPNGSILAQPMSLGSPAERTRDPRLNSKPYSPRSSGSASGCKSEDMQVDAMDGDGDWDRDRDGGRYRDDRGHDLDWDRVRDRNRWRDRERDIYAGWERGGPPRGDYGRRYSSDWWDRDRYRSRDYPRGRW